MITAQVLHQYAACLAPAEGEYRWETLDNWAQWLLRCRMPVVAGPLVSFEPGAVPDWLFMWEHDFDTVRELIYEHIEQVVKRYRHVVSTWNVVSGLHVNTHFSFTFDQIIFLTRMAAMVVTSADPWRPASPIERGPKPETCRGIGSSKLTNPCSGMMWRIGFSPARPSSVASSPRSNGARHSR